MATMAQTFNLRGIIFLPETAYAVRRVPTRAEKRRAFVRRTRQAVLSPLGLLWLIIAGLMGGLISLFAVMPRIPGVIAGIAHREGEAMANFVVCVRLAIPVLSVLVCVLTGEIIHYAKEFTK